MRNIIAFCTALLLAASSAPSLAAGHTPPGDCEDNATFHHEDHADVPSNCLTEIHTGVYEVDGERRICFDDAVVGKDTPGDVTTNVADVDDDGFADTLYVVVTCAAGQQAVANTPFAFASKCYKDFVVGPPVKLAATCETAGGSKTTNACP